MSYAQLGLCALPTKPHGKLPAVRWSEYQHRRPSEAELIDLFHRHRGAGVCILTGQVSGVIVLDSDGPEGEATLRGRHLPATPTVISGKGCHRYFAHPGFAVRNFARRLPGLDLRGDGGLVVAPPSWHPSGRQYRWADGLSPWDVPFAPAPEWLLELATAGGREAPTPVEEWLRVARGVVEGERNDTTARLAGHLLRKGVDARLVLALLLAWNEVRNHPPLPETELAAVVRSIAARELRRRSERDGEA